ncbi:FAD-dependent monooxygenase [Pinirhizobacter sp.]|jgi:2-octaprenyl-6-methoxyphenol hydroxylase|uniref:FAD-dependent monooxygenase n=1 Tax=Pinirhizobacter sp. TaxID=2950432 RepID=UPI002F40FBC9
MTDAHPILIVGGGLVGASLAIALDAAGRDAILVEASAPRAPAPAGPGDRNLALARATVNGLIAIDAWEHARTAATAISDIHVTRAGDFGSVRLSARAAGVDAMGWTLPAPALGAALAARLDRCTRLQRLAPARLEALEYTGDAWHARLATSNGAQDVRAALLVGADGTDSFVRTSLGIGTDDIDYRQSLFVATAAPARAHGLRAFERFTDDGPVAILPLAQGRVGIIVTVGAADADRIQGLADDDFLAEVQRRFGWRLGKLTRPGPRFRHDIRRVAASGIVGPRAVLVGNAAQTIHPIGAQGFNLGLRDALTLAELTSPAVDPGDAGLLAAYAERRQADRDATMAMSHGLASLACLPEPALGPLRSLMMLAMGTPPLRAAMTARGMGLRAGAPIAVREGHA